MIGARRTLQHNRRLDHPAAETKEASVKMRAIPECAGV